MWKSKFSYVVALVLATGLVGVAVAGKGGHPKATGEATFKAGAVTIDMEFAAHGTDPAKGNVSYQASNGNSFKGTVTHYYMGSNANEAAFCGVITEGTFTGYFKVEVQDNGNGPNVPSPDRLRVQIDATTPFPCDNISTSFPAVLISGNIAVH